jgi:hypothetical protein
MAYEMKGAMMDSEGTDEMGVALGLVWPLRLFATVYTIDASNRIGLQQESIWGNGYRKEEHHCPFTLFRYLCTSERVAGLRCRTHGALTPHATYIAMTMQRCNPANEDNQNPISLPSNYTKYLVVHDVVAQSACNAAVGLEGLGLPSLTLLSRSTSRTRAPLRDLRSLLGALMPVSFALTLRARQAHLTVLLAVHILHVLVAILLLRSTLSQHPIPLSTHLPPRFPLRTIDQTLHHLTHLTHDILIILDPKVIPVLRRTALPRLQRTNVGVQILACLVDARNVGGRPARSAIGVARVVDDEVVRAGCAAHEVVKRGVPELGRAGGGVLGVGAVLVLVVIARVGAGVGGEVAGRDGDHVGIRGAVAVGVRRRSRAMVARRRCMAS